MRRSSSRSTHPINLGRDFRCKGLNVIDTKVRSQDCLPACGLGEGGKNSVLYKNKILNERISWSSERHLYNCTASSFKTRSELTVSAHSSPNAPKFREDCIETISLAHLGRCSLRAEIDNRTTLVWAGITPLNSPDCFIPAKLTAIHGLMWDHA